MSEIESYIKGKPELPKEKPSYAWMQPFIYGFLLAMGIMAGYFLRKPEPSRFDELLHVIEKNYVDTLDYKRVSEDAFNSFLKTLDPHSTYIPVEEVKGVTESLEGNFEGIGVEFNIYKDTVAIMHVIPGGPSEKSGLKPGDKIVEAAGKKIAGVGIKENEVIKLLKGPRSTKVTIKVKRKGQRSLLIYNITRGVIPLYSVDAAYKIDEHTGYIKVNRFSGNTLEEFSEHLDKLKKEGVRRLVLDLRDNPGGFLTAATGMLDDFIPKGKLMLYTEGNRSARVTYKSTSGGDFEDGEVVVLINEYSASASEIVAGSLQDHDRAVIVGRRTYGKGLVQEPFRLSDGSLVRLTIARYYTPSGRCIQKPYNDDYEMELTNRFRNGELYYDSLFREHDTTFFKTVNGRRVFGGGGVKPDLFVPIDTSGIPAFIRNSFKNGLFRFYAALYTENFSDLKSKYPDYRSFSSNYKVPEFVMEQFRQFIAESDIIVSKEEVSRNYLMAERHLKAVLARQMYGTEGYYFILNQDDRMIRTAVENISRSQALLNP